MKVTLKKIEYIEEFFFSLLSLLFMNQTCEVRTLLPYHSKQKKTVSGEATTTNSQCKTNIQTHLHISCTFCMCTDEQVGH